MQLYFNAVSEPAKPGLKWQKLFNIHWNAYREWFDSGQQNYVPDLETSQAALRKYMPEMWPTYKFFCKLAKADKTAARFLTGFQPPAYVNACSQAVLTGEEIRLIRNYDYHPDHMEGTQLLSAWNGKKVIATSDCLIGAVDGMNEDGLAISLTFGGRRVVGVGFGIPFILRYVLEFCNTVEEAVEALTRIPSHVSYNVTVVDRSGAYKTVCLAPDREPIITDNAYATNHQIKVDWPENAAFNKTVERSDFLGSILNDEKIKAEAVADAFLEPPLYNTLFSEGLGTLYTADYRPQEGKVKLRWPKESLCQEFDRFTEKSTAIRFSQSGSSVRKAKRRTDWNTDWQENVSEILVQAALEKDVRK